jgi:two-component system, NarL family, sensor histidine kinase UhpB
MTSRWSPSQWSITQRLLLVVMLPSLIIAATLAVSAYTTGERDIEDKIATSGQLLARALAETSQYDVVARNQEVLDHSIQRILAADPSIVAIEILDDEGHTIARRSHKASGTEVRFEEAIFGDAPDVQLFDNSAPHAEVLSNADPVYKQGRRVGTVKVLMSTGPLLVGQRHRLIVATLVAAFSFVVASGLGMYLARSVQAPVLTILEVLRSIRQGRLDVRFAKKATGELGEMQQVIKSMADGLSMTRRDFENEVRTRTEELHRAVAAKRQLIAHSNDLVEEERRRISRDLHDQFNASLLSIKFNAAALQPRDGRELEREVVQARAKVIMDAVVKLYEDSRRMVKKLRPEVLDTLGLVGAISEAVRNLDEDQTSCSIALDVQGDIPTLSDRVSIAAFRAVQEALSNVLKHSRASRALVVVKSDHATRSVNIAVRDNGIGFDTARPASGFGLAGMRERVESVGGRFNIQSKHGRGTKVAMSFSEHPDSPAAPETTW